jgi:hypothetical protein
LDSFSALTVLTKPTTAANYLSFVAGAAIVSGHLVVSSCQLSVRRYSALSLCLEQPIRLRCLPHDQILLRRSRILGFNKELTILSSVLLALLHWDALF